MRTGSFFILIMNCEVGEIFIRAYHLKALKSVIHNFYFTSKMLFSFFTSAIKPAGSISIFLMLFFAAGISNS